MCIKVFKDHESAIFRFALDLVTKNLANNDIMTMDQIEASFKAGERSAGASIGHEANNLITKGVNTLNNYMTKSQDEAVTDKNWTKATVQTIVNTIMKSTVLAFKGGGTNWVVIGAEKGIPLVGITHALYLKKAEVKGIDLNTELGRKNLAKELYYQGRYRDTMVRGMYAVGMFIASLLSLGYKGDDEETLAKEIAKWMRRKENKWARPYITKISPVAFSSYIAFEGSGKEQAKYLGDLFNVGQDYYDNTHQLLKSISSKKEGTTKDAVGKLATAPFNTPGNWKTIKDLIDIYRGFAGLRPLKEDKKAVTGYLEGATRGGSIEFIGNVYNNATKEPKKKKE